MNNNRADMQRWAEEGAKVFAKGMSIAHYRILRLLKGMKGDNVATLSYLAIRSETTVKGVSNMLITFKSGGFITGDSKTGYQITPAGEGVLVQAEKLLKPL